MVEPIDCSVEPNTKPAKKKKRKTLTINLTHCKYDCVRRVAVRYGMRPVTDDEDWTVYWTDTSVLLESVLAMGVHKYQKINHFPGMSEICRKDLLARNMNRMRRAFPRDYNCFPRTWGLPADFGDLQAYCKAKKRTFICKPENSCQGKGIFIIKNLKDIPPGEHLVCQEYIAHPFTLDDFKFDLRIYVLVTSCDPLYIYVYNEGLARFATTKYETPSPSNVKDVCMHLTNYAINKHSKDFVNDEECGSKRRISCINKSMEEKGYDLKKIWQSIEDVIIKTIIAAHPVLKHNYRSCFPEHNHGSACFEVLGFDVLLDRKLRPWLLEVNHSPSFHTDAPIDREIKESMLYDTLNLIDLYANDKKKCLEEERRKVQDRLQKNATDVASNSKVDDLARTKYEEHVKEYEKGHLGGFRRIYPGNNDQYYEQFFNQSTSLCAETIASKARIELSRQLREEIETKQKEMAQYLQRPPKKAVSEPAEPESPGREGEKTTTVVIKKRRRPAFPIPASPPPPSSQKDYNPEPQQPDVHLSSTSAPDMIKEEEELERLAGLQLRDSLLKGLGIHGQIQDLLKGGVHKTSDAKQSIGKTLSYTFLPQQVPIPPPSNPSSTLQPPMLPHQNFAPPVHRLKMAPMSLKAVRMMQKSHNRQPISLEVASDVVGLSVGLSVVSTPVKLMCRQSSQSSASERRSNYLLSTRPNYAITPQTFVYANPFYPSATNC